MRSGDTTSLFLGEDPTGTVQGGAGGLPYVLTMPGPANPQ